VFSVRWSSEGPRTRPGMWLSVPGLKRLLLTKTQTQGSGRGDTMREWCHNDAFCACSCSRTGEREWLMASQPWQRAHGHEAAPKKRRYAHARTTQHGEHSKTRLELLALLDRAANCRRFLRGRPAGTAEAAGCRLRVPSSVASAAAAPGPSWSTLDHGLLYN